MTAQTPDIPSDESWMGCGRVTAELDADEKTQAWGGEPWSALLQPCQKLWKTQLITFLRRKEDS